MVTVLSLIEDKHWVLPICHCLDTIGQKIIEEPCGTKVFLLASPADLWSPVDKRTGDF